MALSASLATPLTTVPAEYQVQCHITISNSGSSAVTIKQIRPAIKSTPISFSEDKSSFVAASLDLQDFKFLRADRNSFSCKLYFTVQLAAVLMLPPIIQPMIWDALSMPPMAL